MAPADRMISLPEMVSIFPSFSTVIPMAREFSKLRDLTKVSGEIDRFGLSILGLK